MTRLIPRTIPLRWVLVALATVACGHSNSFVTGANRLDTPFASGSDIRLTWNADQDYWPALTEDSTAVLFAYVATGRADHDRCVGLVPTGGGTDLWQLCETQPGHADSTDSFAAFALGRDGRLLYQEVSAHVNVEVPTSNNLWLADSARPFARRKLLTFPIILGGTGVNWLGDLAWTGPADFIALAQEYQPVPHCRSCILDDSAFVGKFVVRGHIDASGATLTPVAGTQGANSFALAEGGSAIVFALRSGTQLYGVAASGGTAVLLGSVGPQSTVAGIACRNLTCLVTTDSVTLLPSTQTDLFPSVGTPKGSLYRFDVTSGVAQLRRSNTAPGNAGMYSSLLILPNGTDVVIQSGGTVGRLHTASSTAGDLYLYKGILP